MNQQPRVVILGAGMIANVHRRAVLLAGGQLVGVMDSTPDKSVHTSEQWRTSPVRGLDDLAAARPDVVHVCTPNHLHADHVRAAVDAGAHVICEKPLSTDSTVAQELADLTRQHDRVATVPFVYRFHPLVREVRARAQAGEFGPWQLLHGSYLQDWLLSPQATNWRVSAATGGPSRTFADIGSHWCDLMEFVTGEQIAEVYAQTTITVPQRPSPDPTQTEPLTVDTEDAASVVFTTRTGVLGTVTVSQVAAGRKNRLWFEFDGPDQSAVFDQQEPETAWLGTLTSEAIIRRDPGVGAPDARRLSTLPPGHPQGYAQCFEAFVADTYAAVAGEARDGLPSFADGARSARIVDAVIASARSGQRQTVAGPTEVPAHSAPQPVNAVDSDPHHVTNSHPATTIVASTQGTQP